MPLSRHSVGTYPGTSSRATCQGIFSRSRLSSLSHCGLILAKKNGIGVRKLISTLKKKKKRRRKMNDRTFSKYPRKRGKSRHEGISTDNPGKHRSFFLSFFLNGKNSLYTAERKSGQCGYSERKPSHLNVFLAFLPRPLLPLRSISGYFILF